MRLRVVGQTTLLFSAVILFANCESKRESSIYELPVNYRGWVFIFWEREGAPAIIRDKEGLQFKIPRDGIVRTSSAQPTGFAEDSYYWKAPNGNREFFGKTGNAMIHMQGGGLRRVGNNAEIKYSRFYVGNERPNENSLELALDEAVTEITKLEPTSQP